MHHLSLSLPTSPLHHNNHHHPPLFTCDRRSSTLPHRPILSTAVAPVKRSPSALLSAIDRAIEEEEYRKARAQVNRKGIDVEGYLIEGISIGGHETCVVVPSMNLAFDIGRCPARAVSQDFLFITHAHLDHIMTFLDEEHDIDHARNHGHVHISEILEHAQWFRNKAILFTHFSSRYKIEDIRQAMLKVQPSLSPKVVALTEGFKSMYRGS